MEGSLATLAFHEMKQIVEIAMDQEIATLDENVDLYEELGMDSIGAVAMIVEIQRRCLVRIPEEVVPELRTPRLLLEYIRAAPESTVAEAGVA
jgi:acyl carrier protein